MADRKWFVRCLTGCLAEGMTKEQILTAITQAVENGKIHDIDTGFITKIVEQNKQMPLSFWVGTSAEYNAIENKNEDCFYIITDKAEANGFLKLEDITTEINKNSTDDKCPTAKAVYKYGQKVLSETEVTATAQGNALTIESANAPLQNLKLYGSTEQNGTPTPTAPKELKSVGDSGSFEVGVYGRNILNLDEMLNAFLTKNSDGTYTMTKIDNSGGRFSAYQNVFIPANSPLWFSAESVNYTGQKGYWFCLQFLASDNSTTFEMSHGNIGVKTTFDKDIVSVRAFLLTNDENGTISTIKNAQLVISDVNLPYEPCNKQTLTMPYTLRSVGEIKDEVDFNRGVHTRPTLYKSLKDYTWKIHNPTNDGSGFIFYAIDNNLKNFGSIPCLSTHLKYNWQGTWEDLSAGQIMVAGNCYIIVATAHTTLAEFTQWLTENDPKFISLLATPQETPLSETELNAYRQLMTNKGTTTILSEAFAEVDYYINKPNAQAVGNIHSQVNADYIKIQQAIISLGGNV